MSQRDCPICQSKESDLLFNQKFIGMSSGSLLDSYDVVTCQKCGFGYADNIPKQEVFDAYYQDMSKYEYQDTSGQESPQDLIRFQALVDTLIPFLAPEHRILEIGCATGKLLSLLKIQGYKEVSGLDPSSVCVKTAQERYDIFVYNHNLWEVPVPVDKFDCIIMSAVLEHIRDLDRCLHKITALLSVGGIVQIEVPDASCLAEVNGAPFQEFSTEHIDFFSPASLNNLFQINGYEQLLCNQTVRQQTDSTLMPVITAIYQYTGNKSRELTSDLFTKASLLAYINNSRLIEAKLHKTINNIVENEQSIVIWGVGTHTQRLLATSNLSQANISAFIDSNPRYQGKFLQGSPIISPADLINYSEPIMISSQVFQSEIKREVEENLKLNNHLILLY